MNKIHLSSIDSTNSYLKLNYKKLNNYTFVSCDNQTNGKGRNSREWKSENGKNLLFSLLILDKLLIQKYKEVSIVTALTISKMLEDFCSEKVTIKWPNDVYVNSNKIAGILLESVSVEEMECLIVGVGLNVNQKEFNGEFLVKPTSIINILNKEQNIDILKNELYNRLIKNYEKILENYDFYPYINKHDYLKGKNAYAYIDNTNKLVNIMGINNDYSLSILNNNKVEKIESGEISFHVSK